MKKKFLDKYFYLENNMDLINILYNSNPSLNLFEEVENLLFSDDELINNEGFDFFEFLKKFKPILLDNALEKYKYDNNSKIWLDIFKYVIVDKEKKNFFDEDQLIIE